MLIVLEGCDGSGKSTLATLLSQVLNAEIIHCSTRTPNDFAFFHDILCMSRDKNIIADRWCYGQFVYQSPEDRPLRRSESVLQPHVTAEERLQQLEMLMLEQGAKMILVTAPDEVIKSRLKDRGEILINGLTVEEIQSKFRDLKNHSLLTWTEYNTGGCKNV